MAEKLFALRRHEAEKLKQLMATETHTAQGGNAVLLPKRGESVSVKFFKLIEDVTGNGDFLAQECNENGTVIDENATEITNWGGLLTNAKPNYRALFARYGEKWVFVQGPCITIDCNNAGGSINLNNPPTTGLVGQPYFHTVLKNNLTGSMGATGLPPGLTFNGTTGVISGTPTEAGTFTIIITGVTSPNNCTIRRAFVLRISPGENGGGGPNPNPELGADNSNLSLNSNIQEDLII